MGAALRNRAGYIGEYVGDNEVGEKGCRHLSKAAWGDLEEIVLGHCSLTKTLTKSGTGAVSTSSGEAGRE